LQYAKGTSTNPNYAIRLTHTQNRDRMSAMNNIKNLLTERGKSIYWLHKQVGMSYQAVHKLVNAPAIPPGTTWGTLTRIAAALGVGVEELERHE